MLGLAPDSRQQAFFVYDFQLDSRVPADHLLRKVKSQVSLDFVIPLVRHSYGRSGHVSLDPRLIVKMMILLFLYDIPSERELMDQIKVRLDFLWFLDFDLESRIPDHSVLSKARARWGSEVFEAIFSQSVAQCVAADLVEGRLLHTDSTMVKANASKDSVVGSSPELVKALRQAYQDFQRRLTLPAQAEEPVAAVDPKPTDLPTVVPAPRAPQPEEPSESEASSQGASPPTAKKLPVNSTRISLSDPEAQLSRSKNGLTELNYKDHRIVDDAHGVITAVEATHGNVGDATQLPPLLEQHSWNTGRPVAGAAVAGDHHYGSASNYIYCIEQGIRPHLASAGAHLEEKGKLPLSRFVYLAEEDRLRCPQGHDLVLHQHRPEEQLKVYWIEDPRHCAECPLREQCTHSERGRSIRRHVKAEVVEAGQAQANSRAGRWSRKRRRHVMEGSFADAANNHGAKRARWRGLGRQRIQSFLIAAVQNWRILLKKTGGDPPAQGLAAVAVAVSPITKQILSEFSAPGRRAQLLAARFRCWLVNIVQVWEPV